MISLIKIIGDSFILNKGIINSYKWIQLKLNNVDGNSVNGTPPINFILLIPVYKEQKNIQMIFEHFANLNFKDYKVIFVVSELEESANESDKTTLIYIKEYLEEYKRKYINDKFSYIVYPYKNGSKAKKLNYALDKLKTDHEYLENTYIGVYDADSRPNLNTLISIETEAARCYKSSGQYPIAFQQPSYFTKNIDDLGAYLKLEAIFQTRWCFGHEIRTQRISCKKNKYRVPYAYCVGHGMFIQYDFLVNNYGFPEPIEDVPMGFRLDLLNIPIIPIWLFDYAEVVTSVKALILQSGQWAKNAFLVFCEIKKMHKLKVKPNYYRAFILLLKGANDVFSWLHYLLCFITAIILSFQYTSFIFIELFILSSFIDSGIGTIIMVTILKNTIWKKGQSSFKYYIYIVWLILLSPLRGIIRGLAPFLALFYFGKDMYNRRINS